LIGGGEGDRGLLGLLLDELERVDRAAELLDLVHQHHEPPSMSSVRFSMKQEPAKGSTVSATPDS